MNRSSHRSFAVALVASALVALSCSTGESTGPGDTAALPADSLPHLAIDMPPGRAMTRGTTERLALRALNVRPRSCGLTASGWLGLAPGANGDSAWTVAPAASGSAAITVSCTDFRRHAVSFTDTLLVYDPPTVTPDISGVVPVAVGDSIDVRYDSTDTPRIDVTCNRCESFATLARTVANTVRLVARSTPADTVSRSICFTALGLDGRFTFRQCVAVSIIPAQPALFSVPAAIRASEVVPLHSIPVATYDGTGQSTHPDFVRVAAPWAGGSCWLAYTPYYQSNGGLENPSLATSADCEHWSPAEGVAAPLVAKPADGYNSDPELMSDERRGCLGVVFRQVHAQNVIYLTSTCDGRTFSAPRQLLAAPNHSAVSPTVAAGPDGFSRIWYVDAGPAGCTSQTNVVKLRTATTDTAGLGTIQFGAEVRTDLVQPGYVIWHMKVRYVAALRQYLAMYVAFPMTTGVGDCTNDDLFVATSPDGVHWRSFQAPILDHLDRRFTFESLYRASFLYDDASDQLRTIVSGLDAAHNWGQYGVVHGFAALALALDSSRTVAAAQLIPPPSLVRKPGPKIQKVIMEDRP